MIIIAPRVNYTEMNIRDKYMSCAESNFKQINSNQRRQKLNAKKSLKNKLI